MIIIDCFGDNGQTGTPGAQNDEVPEQHLGGSRLESVAMGCRVFSYDVLSKEVEEDHKCVKTFKADHPLFLAFTRFFIIKACKYTYSLYLSSVFDLVVQQDIRK